MMLFYVCSVTNPSAIKNPLIKKGGESDTPLKVVETWFSDLFGL